MDFTCLEKYIKELHNHGIPACDIMVMKDHKLLFRTMNGFSDYQGKTPVSENDLYYIFSNTKLVTVVAIMQLIEQGKLSLLDEVSKYIPAYKNMTVKDKGKIIPATNKITIYQLLTMTSGLNYDPCPYVEQFAKENPNLSTFEIISALAKEPLSFNPGERWKYGRSHDVLGAVVEVVSGMKFGNYLQEYIFDPLGMKYTTFDLNSQYVKKHISAFYDYDGKNEKAIPSKYNWETRWSENYQIGGAGLVSSTEDYALLVDALANGGIGKTGNQILLPETIEQIKQPQLDVLKQSQFIFSHNKKGYSYGLGVRTLIDKGFGAKSPIGEFAWDGMTGGYGLVDTENKIAISYMQNVSGCSYAWHTVFPDTRDMIYEILGIN